MENYLNEIINYLLTQSWQIAILVAVIATVNFALKNKSAHVRYLLWLIVLAKCMVPPLATMPLAVLPEEKPVMALEPVDLAVAEPVVKSSSPSPVPKLPARIVRAEPPRLSVRQWLGLVWIAGAAVFILVAVVKALRTEFWLRGQRKPFSSELQSGIENLFSDFNLRTFPKVWLVNGIGQPFVWGLLRGSIYLPADFVKVGSAEHRRGVLGHELSHILRFDAAVNILQVIAQVVFWFHPFVWWANKKIRAEREKCCDEMAIARLGTKAKDYSTAIVETLVAEYESTRRVPSLAIAGPVKNIEERIKTIMKPGKKFYKRPSLIAATVVLVLAMVTVPTALVLTARAKTEAATEHAEKRYESLFEAAKAGDLAEVKRLIAEGADVNVKDEDGETALYKATGYNHKDIAKLLIEEGADVNVKDEDGRTALFTAAVWDQRDIAKLLIDAGANVNATENRESGAPLHYAVLHNNNKEVVSLLISKGADVNLTDKYKQTPLHFVVDSPLEKLPVLDLDIIKLLVDNGAKFDVKDSDGYTALRYAALWGQTDTVKLFLSKGADTSSLHMAACAGDLSRVKKIIAQGTKVDQKDEKGWTALFWAASAGQTEVDKFLIDNNADISANDGHGQSLLHQAALTNAVKLADLLIAKGADVNAKSTTARFYGGTPLHLACGRGNKEVAELLIDKGADINGKAGARGRTPISSAARYGRKDMIELLISKGAEVNASNALLSAAGREYIELVKLWIAKGADVNAKDAQGSTALHEASSNGNQELAKILISAGADVNVGDNLSRTPLDLAEKNRHTEIIELLKKHGGKKGTPTLLGAVDAGDIELVQSLISKGADVNVKNDRGETPLHLLKRGNRDIAELLIAKGADVNAKNNNGSTPLHWPYGIKKDIVELLIAKGADVNARDNAGNTPLITPFGMAKDIAELLIAKGADVNANNNGNETPLMRAAITGRRDLAELLIDKGTDVNAKDRAGRTPLHYAASQGHKEVVEVLIAKGADVNVSNNAGVTPLGMAEERGNTEIVEILQKHGAKD